MKVGIFDSGLGGLLVAQTLHRELPQYSYLYLGDTANMPYGNKSQPEIYHLVERGIDYLLKQGCALIIVACNTASAEALRQIQQVFLVQKSGSQNVLGITIPLVEAALQNNPKHIGVLGTQATVDSGAFTREIQKLNPNVLVTAYPLPQLALAVEYQNERLIEEILLQTIPQIKADGIDTLILGCTHYGLVVDKIKSALSSPIPVIAAESIIAPKLLDYLVRHPATAKLLGKHNSLTIQVTKRTPAINQVMRQFLPDNTIQTIKID